MIVAGTGHRPDKLGGYDWPAFVELTAFARRCLVVLRPDEIISGMAQGWDQALAAAALDLGIPFTAAVPCDNQDARWGEGRALYRMLLGKAASVVVVCPGPYAAWKMQARNAWMADRLGGGDVLLALWDGSRGGTANCVDYARRVGKRVVNVYEIWRVARADFLPVEQR